MKKIVTSLLLFLTCTSFCQTTKFSFNWQTIKNDDNLPQRESKWIHDNLSDNEINEVINLVMALTHPSASQMLVSYFYLDGSFSNARIESYIDSFKVRPPDGDAGIIRVAYLVSKLRKDLVDKGKSNKIYTHEFSGKPFETLEYVKTDINKNIELSFDFQPVQVILDILSEPDISYQEILSKISIFQFDELFHHRSQSFYYAPTNKERLVTCLEIAASTKPLDKLYKYMIPKGLLNFSEVHNNLEQYKKLIKELSKHETQISNFINASISPYLPTKSSFKRNVSFFFMNGADGWATSKVTAVDLNYFKNDYEKLLRLLVHESYHGGQKSVSVYDSTEHENNIQLFLDAIDYLFMEGTATYVAPPAVKTEVEREEAIGKGIQILEEIYTNTIVNYDAVKTRQLINKGVEGGGPFYWLGAEISGIIEKESGKEALASIIPYNGATFMKSYLTAVQKSKTNKSMFSNSIVEFIQNLK